MESGNHLKKVMQLVSLRNGFLALTLSAIASTSGLLAACSQQKQAETPNVTTTNGL